MRMALPVNRARTTRLALAVLQSVPIVRRGCLVLAEQVRVNLANPVQCPARTALSVTVALQALAPSTAPLRAYLAKTGTMPVRVEKLIVIYALRELQ